ncbi:hypothetical protein [Komagataeibacter rhaeticus]|uniref:hypothetical protein n=1 Tax=Komagataeibacter rhaeticus TaxID=215221 RepID=UPI001A45A917|nr:hypothetical protein [Komagataeibacter rhaeticus]MBL7240398.1 hypothetical protein [Komagataeibacter rhaeticus]
MPDRLPTGTPHARTGGLPDREQLRAFIENATGRIGKREISREFGLGPEHRQGLRQMEGSKNRWLMRLARDFRLLAI